MFENGKKIYSPKEREIYMCDEMAMTGNRKRQ